MLWHPLHKFLDGVPCGEPDPRSQLQSRRGSQRGHIGDDDEEDDERDYADRDENPTNDIDIHDNAVDENKFDGERKKTSLFDNGPGGPRQDDNVLVILVDFYTNLSTTKRAVK